MILRNPVQNADLTVNNSDFASATVRVPEDFPTIQLAVNSANPGDTVRVGAGRWCGALVSKPLSIVGESATIMGCPPGPAGTGPVGNMFKVGLFIARTAPGTSISIAGSGRVTRHSYKARGHAAARAFLCGVEIIPLDVSKNFTQLSFKSGNAIHC